MGSTGDVSVTRSRRPQRVAIRAAAVGEVLLLGLVSATAVLAYRGVPAGSDYDVDREDILDSLVMAGIGFAICLLLLLIAWGRPARPNAYDRIVPPPWVLLIAVGVGLAIFFAFSAADDMGPSWYAPWWDLLFWVSGAAAFAWAGVACFGRRLVDVDERAVEAVERVLQDRPLPALSDDPNVTLMDRAALESALNDPAIRRQAEERLQARSDLMRVSITRAGDDPVPVKVVVRSYKGFSIVVWLGVGALCALIAWAANGPPPDGDVGVARAIAVVSAGCLVGAARAFVGPILRASPVGVTVVNFLSWHHIRWSELLGVTTDSGRDGETAERSRDWLVLQTPHGPVSPHAAIGDGSAVGGQLLQVRDALLAMRDEHAPTQDATTVDDAPVLTRRSRRHEAQAAGDATNATTHEYYRFTRPGWQRKLGWAAFAGLIALLAWLFASPPSPGDEPLMTHWWQVPIVGAIVGNLAFLVLKTANGCDVFVDRDGAWLRGECFRWEDMDEVHLERNDGEREVVLNMRDDREGLSVDGFDLPKAAYHGLLEVLDRGLTDPGLRPTGTAPAEERAASPGVSEGLMWTLVALPALGSCAAASVLIIERGYV